MYPLVLYRSLRDGCFCEKTRLHLWQCKNQNCQLPQRKNSSKEHIIEVYVHPVTTESFVTYYFVTYCFVLEQCYFFTLSELMQAQKYFTITIKVLRESQ